MKKILILSLTLLASNFAKASEHNGNSNASAPSLDLSDSTTPPATATPPASAASTPAGSARAGFGKQSRHLRVPSQSPWTHNGQWLGEAALEKFLADKKTEGTGKTAQPSKTAATSKAKSPVASPTAKK